MDPEKIRQLIPQYITQELDPAETKMVQDYLETDPALKSYADDMRRSWEFLERIETIAPSPAYMSEFWTRLSGKKSRWEQWGAIPLFQRKWVPVLSAVCVFFLVLTYVKGHRSHRLSGQMAGLEEISADELELLENYELAENLDVIEDIDTLEDMEYLDQLDEFDISYAT